jgi:hypothetical protein
MEFDIKMIDKFSSQRDSLVNAGVLFPPYTDTKEYREILIDQILFYRKNNNWINRIHSVN